MTTSPAPWSLLHRLKQQELLTCSGQLRTLQDVLDRNQGQQQKLHQALQYYSLQPSTPLPVALLKNQRQFYQTIETTLSQLQIQYQQDLRRRDQLQQQWQRLKAQADGYQKLADKARQTVLESRLKQEEKTLADLIETRQQSSDKDPF